MRIDPIADLGGFLRRGFRYRFVGETVACNLCRGADYAVVGRRERMGGRLRTVMCRRCGLVFTNPMPTSAEVADYYRHRYRALLTGSDAPRPKDIARGVRRAASRADALAAFLRPGTRALEVGAGTGAFVAELARRGLESEGIEPGLAWAAYARQTSGRPIAVCGWEEARFAPASFALIAIHHVVEHLRDPAAALARAREWLRPDGHLYVSVPDFADPRRTPFTRFQFAHLHNFNRASLLMLGAKVGLAPVDSPFRETSCVFRKAPPDPAPYRLFPDNFPTLQAFMAEHTAWRYLAMATPYRRFAARVASYVRVGDCDATDPPRPSD